MRSPVKTLLLALGLVGLIHAALTSSLGWVEGGTGDIEVRWSRGRPERVVEIATEFVRQKLDVILSYGGAVTTLKKATTSIPIVFAIAVDPIGIGLVPSLSRPGGNVTGLSAQQGDTPGKRLELLRQVVPNLRRLAIVFDGGYPAADLKWRGFTLWLSSLASQYSQKGSSKRKKFRQS